MALNHTLKADLHKPGQRGAPCRVRALLDALEPEDREVLQALLDDPFIQSTVLARALQDDGYPMHDWNVGRHRRGQCRCGRA